MAKTIDVATLIGKTTKTNGWFDMRSSGLFDCNDADHNIRTLSGLIHHARGRASRTCNALAVLQSLIDTKVVLPTELAAVVADMNGGEKVDYDVLWPKIAARIAK